MTAPLALLVRACRIAGMEAEGARLLRMGSNAVFRLTAPVIVRISRPDADVGHARRTVAVADQAPCAGGRRRRPLGCSGPRPCLYAAGMAGDMTCGICGPLRFGLPGDAWHGGWFLALAVPEIPA
jgi:hypothetical protein